MFAVIFSANSIKIVRQYEKGIIETLGKYTAIREPGANIIIPIFQRMLKVDMRERVIDVPPQSVITKDNVSVIVDAIIYFQVTDPIRVIYNIEDFAIAALKLAQTNLRNLIGDMELDNTLTSREKINTQLRTVMDDATDKWGVKVTRVEIQKIDPPKDITNAMSKQMKAEREKRANILEAEGLRQAAILKAEGAKQSVILNAEAIKEKQILEAIGKSEALKNIASAEKYKIEIIYNAIKNSHPTTELIAIKYLESLNSIANGQATKIFLPLDINGVMSSIGGISELFKKTQK
jgi:regulator of protease activity HflC (stomatin/prohibitin superfamily)